jgi:hypothetical protein
MTRLKLGDKVWVHTDYEGARQFSYFEERLPATGTVTRIHEHGHIEVKIGTLIQDIMPCQYYIVNEENLKVEDFV